MATRTFVAIQDAQFLVSWEESDLKLQRLVRHRFEEGGEILSVIVDRKLGEKVGVVFSSGLLALLTTGEPTLDHTLKLVPEEYHVMSCTHSKRTQNDIAVFALAAKDSPVSGHYKLFVASIVHSANEGAILKQYAPHEVASVRSNHVITNLAFDASAQLFAFLWDDGLLEIYSLPGGTQGLASQNSLSLTHSLPLAAYRHNLVNKALIQKSSKTPKKGAKPAPHVSARDLERSGNALVSIAEGHVVIVGKKDENEETYLLTVWDLRYGLVTLHAELDLQSLLEKQTSTSLPTQQTGNKSSKSRGALPDRFLRHAVFSADKNCVILNFGQLVLACPIYVGPSSLAQALGGKSATEKFLLPRASSEHSPSQQFDYLSHAHAPVKARGLYAGFMKVTQDDFQGIVSDHVQRELSATTQLIDRSKTPDYTSFMEVFNSYIAYAAEIASREEHGQEIEVSHKHARSGISSRTRPRRWKNLQEYSEHENAKVEKARILGRMKQHVDFSPAFIQAVVSRCLQEDYLWHPLRRLIESRCVSMKLNPSLLSVLKSNNRLDLISSALQFVPDISELEVVSVVRWLISEVDQASLQIFVDEHVYQKGYATAMEVDSSAPGESSVSAATWSAIDCYLNVVVNMCLDDMFLQYCMQLLTLKEMTAMLKFLLHWFENCASQDCSKSTVRATSEEGANVDGEEKENYFAPPPLGRVVAWANAIVDSHLAELILVPDCARLLRRLHTAITRTIEVCDGMQLLRGCLMHYFDHDPSPRDSVSDYSIELLRL